MTFITNISGYILTDGFVLAAGFTLNDATSNPSFMFNATGELDLYQNALIRADSPTTGIKSVLALSSDDDAVNYLEIFNGATASNVGIAATGDDTNIDIAFEPKGTGIVRVVSGLQATDALKTLDASSGGIHSREMASATTTDATVTDLFTLALVEGDIVSIEIDVVGNVDSTGANRAQYKLTGLFYRNTAGNVTQQGSTTSISTIESDSDWDCDLVADTGNQTIDVRVTGKAATTINWLATIKYTKLS
jgi:hypothetical protein